MRFLLSSLPKFLQFSPVRGRKLTLEAINNRLLLFVSKHYPRKGTETLKASYSKAMQEDKAVSKHYPRKGTETCNCTGAGWLLPV